MEGLTVWFTGLPSSGKSTLAALLRDALRSRGLTVELLDGDEVRTELTRGLGFSREDRDENIRRIAWVAKVLTRNGIVAITAAISPYRAARERARQEIGRFVEVYVDCPVEVCMQRDVKGLYARARRGEIEQFTGVSDPYEAPPHPEVVVHTDREAPAESLQGIVAYLEAAGLLRAAMTAVPVPTYLAQRLRELWGEAWTARLSELLATHTAAAAEPLHEAEREEVLARLRELGYVD